MASLALDPSKTTLISHLSNEIWAEICSYLSSPSILTLVKLIGCSSIESKIKASLSVLFHRFNAESKHMVRPTELFSQFAHLRVFRLHLHPAQAHPPALLDLEAISSIPSTITDLSFDFTTCMDAFFVQVPYRLFERPFLINYPSGVNFKVVSLAKLLPNLTKLHIRARQGWGSRPWATFLQQAFLEHLPPTLQSLTFRVPPGQLVNFDLMRHIPARVSLEHLDLRNSTRNALRLPSACNAFHTLRCMKLSAEIGHMLPETLTHLDVSEYADPEALLKALPQNVTKLELGSSWTSFGGYAAGEWFSLLPTQLRSFKMRNELPLRQEYLQKLPSNLGSLSLRTRTHISDLSGLPRGLTSLTWFISSDHVVVAPLELSTLPRALKTLKIRRVNGYMPFASWHGLPSTLTNLLISVQVDQLSMLIAHIPRTLLALTLAYISVEANPSLFRDLPPSLTSLDINGALSIPFDDLRAATSHLHHLTVPAISIPSPVPPITSTPSPSDILQSLIPPLLRYDLHTVAHFD